MVILAFGREAEMTAPAVRASATLEAPAAFETFLEYESTNGIADVVFARFDDAAISVRAAGQLAGAFVERADVAVLLALHEVRERTLPEIAQAAGLSPSTVGVRVRALAARGAANRVGRRAWVRTGPFPCRLAEATAVELKLADWRRALDQAARYRAFADRTLVAIAERHGRSVRRHAEAFAFNSVGLVVLSPWGDAEAIVKPERVPPFDPTARYVAGERLWLEWTSRAAASPVAAA